jgi:diguanylate cyclase (GGDEF)-like protein/PAS domain S-box-containing protein
MKQKTIEDLEFEIKKYKAALNAAGVDFFDIDFITGQASQSENIVAELGYEESEVDTFEKRNAIFHPDDLKASLIKVDALRKGEINRTDLLFRLFSKTGEVNWVKHDGVLLKEDEQEHFVGLLRNITKEKRYLEELKYLASFDSLTETFNRRSGFERLENDIERHEQVCVTYFDLNNFKSVNDRFGHKAGDRVLKEFSKNILDVIPDDSYLVRIGGDEFLLVFLDYNLAFVNKVLSKILDKPILIRDGETLNYSIGTMMYDKDRHQSVDALIHEADMLMYEKKNKGRV